MPAFLMPALLSQRILLLFALLVFALLGALAAAGVPCAAQSQATPPSPAVAAKLRRLLPFPEAALRSKMDLSIGLRSSPEQGAEFFRVGTDHSVQISAVRRQMTGGTADAARYSTLGWLYHQGGLPVKSKAAFGRSEALYKAVLQKHPNNGSALAGYGLALQASGQTAAAEDSLQRAARTAPNSADVWMAFGSVLASEAAPKTEPERHLERDAGAAYDKAVALAPQNPAAWTARGDFRTWTLPQIQSRPPSTAGISDYEHAAALTPNNPYAQTVVPDVEGMTFEMAHNLYTSPEAAKRQPLAFDRQAKKAVQRITAIAQSHHGRPSVAAYEARAWVQFEFFYDPKGAQKSLRLALQQNPRQRDAADYQIHIAAVIGDYSFMAFVCRRELRRRPEIRLRVLLADADYYISRQKPVYARDALEQMALAHAAAPHDDALRLGLAVLLLKSGQRSDLSRAAVLLRETAPPSPLRTKSPQAEYDLTCGIGAALAGDTNNARRFLGAALQDDPHNQPAKSALALLPATVTNPQENSHVPS